MFSSSVVPRIHAIQAYGNRFRSRLPSSMLSLEEVQEQDRQWREYFDIHEGSAEERYYDIEGLSEYGLIRDFVLLENGKNIVDDPSFKEWGIKFSSKLEENQYVGNFQYLIKQYPFVSMKEMVWILPDGRHLHLPYVWAYEWKVEPGLAQCGKGDLVLTDGKANFMVLEAKWISHLKGKTGRTKRTHNRSKVRQQARTYRDVLKTKYSSCAVSAAVLTNDPPEFVIKYLNTSEAKRAGFDVSDFSFFQLQASKLSIEQFSV